MYYLITFIFVIISPSAALQLYEIMWPTLPNRKFLSTPLLVVIAKPHPFEKKPNYYPYNKKKVLFCNNKHFLLKPFNQSL